MSIFLLHFHAFLKHSEDPRNKKEALKLISEMESERKCPPTAIATEQPSHPSSLSLSLSLSLRGPTHIRASSRISSPCDTPSPPRRPCDAVTYSGTCAF